MQLEERRKSLSIVANLRCIIAGKGPSCLHLGGHVSGHSLSIGTTTQTTYQWFPPFPAFSLPSHTESFHIAIPDRGGYVRICFIYNPL